MARRYGKKTKTERTWKKLSRMKKEELEVFKKHLETHNQLQSKVYNHVLDRLAII